MASEINQILATIDEGNNFLLSGGAGSGKTYTLINLITAIRDRSPKSKIACITYTNVAADEITARANTQNLKASTIHDFLWDNIKSFQLNLIDAMVNLYSLPIDIYTEIETVQYREYKSFKKGIISHNEVIELAEYLFKNFPILSKIISDKYDYIFVDEYQDTSEKVIDILFTYLNNKEYNLYLGFFGDNMQSIYEGVGGINVDDLKFADNQKYYKGIPKILNRRNPQTIIDLANNLRTDGLMQKAEKGVNTPNNNPDGSIKKGNISFLYSSSGSISLEEVKSSKFCAEWDFEGFDIKGKPKTKELFITNSSIAKYADFNTLFELYTKEKIVGSNGYIKRIKEYLKGAPIDNLESYTLAEVLDTIVKRFDDKLDFDKAINLVEKEKTNFDTIQKAINKVNKDYIGISKVLPTRGMLPFILDNQDLFKIALSSNFSELSYTYLDKDKLVGKRKSNNEESNKRNDERDLLVKYLLKIQEILHLYKKKEINKLLKIIDFKITKRFHKKILNEKLEELLSASKMKIQNVLKVADDIAILEMNTQTINFFETKPYLIERIGEINFSEIVNLYNYIEGLTRYSTQHGVKGDEFDNVIIVISKNKIPQLTVCYEYLFESNEIGDNKKYYDRTLNLFYVACTRAKENLIIVFENECSEKILSQARKWFGKKHVIDFDKIKIT